jgi:hypothetical protein
MISSSDILHGRVLIVDNQEANVLLLERLLRGAGYVSITSTSDPGEVCALHRKNGDDLILLDLEMPGMDGFQVISNGVIREGQEQPRFAGNFLSFFRSSCVNGLPVHDASRGIASLTTFSFPADGVDVLSPAKEASK